MESCSVDRAPSAASFLGNGAVMVGRSNELSTAWLPRENAYTNVVVEPPTARSGPFVFTSPSMRRPALAALFVFVLGCSSSDDLSNMMMSTESGALLFDGVDDFVQVADVAALDFSTHVTVSTWVQFAELVSGYGGVVQKDGSGSFGRYGLWAFDDRIEFCIYIDGSSQPCIDSTTSLTIGGWHGTLGSSDSADPSDPMWVSTTWPHS